MRLRKRWGRAERHAGCARRSPAEATEDAGSIPATSTPWTACARGEHSPFGVSDDVGGAEPPHTPHGATGSPTSSVASPSSVRRYTSSPTSTVALRLPRYARHGVTCQHGRLWLPRYAGAPRRRPAYQPHLRARRAAGRPWT